MFMKSQRITVSGRNLQFLQQLSQDMDENSLTEVLSYLLTDIRLLNYQIGNKPAPTPQQPQQASLGYSFDPSTFEHSTPDINRNYQEIDPIIARFATLIEEF
jgi:hypothetical protein